MRFSAGTISRIFFSKSITSHCISASFYSPFSIFFLCPLHIFSIYIILFRPLYILLIKRLDSSSHCWLPAMSLALCFACIEAILSSSIFFSYYHAYTWPCLVYYCLYPFNLFFDSVAMLCFPPFIFISLIQIRYNDYSLFFHYLLWFYVGISQLSACTPYTYLVFFGWFSLSIFLSIYLYLLSLSYTI